MSKIKKRKDSSTGINESQSKKTKTQEITSNEERPKSPNSSLNRVLKIREGSSAQVKKLVVKKLLEPPKLPKIFAEESWNKLKLSIEAIYQKREVSYSLEELYTIVDNICIHKMAEGIYKKLRDECNSFLKIAYREFIQNHGDSLDNELFLQNLNIVWETHCNRMVLIRSIFLTLDRKYAIGTNDVESIWDMGLTLFKLNIVSMLPIRERALNSLLDAIQKERSGETVDRNCIRSLVRMYISLGIYFSDFENKFLESTELFYREESEVGISTLEPAVYLEKISKRLEEENERVNHYIDESTRSRLIPLLDRILIKDHIGTLLSTSFETLLEQNNKEDIKRLYVLVNRVNEAPNLKKSWNTYIKNRGTTMITDESKDETLIDELLNFKRKLMTILEYAFDKNDEFSYALKEAFEHFINTRQNAPPQLLATYLDDKLRNVSKGGVSDIELDRLLDEVLHIFRYINGKDVFEAFYKKDLAKRLLLKKNVTMDAEISMISRLKTECGSQFTQKIEGMIKDIDVSKELSEEFSNSESFKSLDYKIDMDVNILTTSFWPSYQPIEIQLPEVMINLQQVFTKFYLSKHHNRHLVWLHAFGLCTVLSSFKSGRKKLTASVFQTTILSLFNEASSLSYSDIKSSTGFGDENELKQTLQSLVFGKHKILLKDNKTKAIADGDVFSVNENFKAKKYTVIINKIQYKDSEEEKERVKETVFTDRQYQVDAAIVRIMKTRKRLSHNELLTELYQQLKFPCQASDLKKRIEILIEREYLKRLPEDPSIYNYVS